MVAQNRAVDSKNFIYENGVNRKRNGWFEKYRVGKGNINGIFEATLEGVKTILVYGDKQFYKIVDGDVVNITESSTNDSCKVNVDRLLNRRCQMFISQNRCYFVGCGDYLTYGKYGNNYELRRVEDDDNTYIPTTTINIDADGVEGDTVEYMDAVNLLTCRRKNTLVGNVSNSTFTLDAQSIDSNVQVIVEHETIQNDELIVKTYKSIGVGLYDENNVSVGSVDFDNAKITFTIDTYPPLENESNIVVNFGCKVDGYADRINNCEFGIMFGVNGNPDRLFISGNEKFPNVDFYSYMDNLTYFESNTDSALGSSDSRIVGYSRLGDGTLATHKELINGEASIYYRTGESSYEYNEDGSIKKPKVVFSVKAGTIGEGMISKHANANLSGDKIYLSRNGVFGIILSSNIASTERYSRERSQYIKSRLIKHTNLEEAVAIVYRNRYYLAVDNVCYVADARITSQNTSDTDSFNYEWYFWDNMPVRVWCIINDELYFGTEDGRICSFYEGYADKTNEKTESGDLLVEYDRNRIVFNKKLGLKENDVITFTTDIFGLKLAPEEILKVQNNRIFVSEEDILNIFNGTEVYVDNVGLSGLSIKTKYLISDVNLSNCSFGLIKESGEIAEIVSSGFRLCENLKGLELFVTNVGVDSFKIKRTKEDTELKSLVKYNNSQEYQTPSATFVLKKNVVATWYSPIFDFGTNQATKTLLTLTISTEPITSGQVDFGYTTKNSEELIESQGVHMFDFDTLDFNNFTFDTSFANSYTVDIKDYFNFIQLFFKSDNENSCAIHSLTITYKINSINKGVQ